MTTINFLAEIFGFSFVLVPLALLINQKYLKRIFVEVENEATMFGCGVASLIIGLAVILFQNTWTQSWQTIITIIGWVALLKGLAILFIPESMKKWAKKMENAQWLPIALVVLVFIGLAIIYFGFTA